MFSRRYVVLGLMLLMTTACSYFFKDEPKKSNIYNLSFSEKSQVSCVKDNGRILREYFDMARSDKEMASEILRMKRCLRDAVEMFAKHTQGAQKNMYSPQEIHDFLTIAFDAYNYPIDFMNEAFLLKQSLLGGDAQSVSKEDIKRLPLYIDLLYDGLATLAPDRKMLFAKDHSNNLEAFEAASVRLQKVVASFQSLPRKSSGSVDYNGFVRLVKYFHDGSEDQEHWDQTFKLINSLQAFLTVGQEGVIDIRQLPSVLNNLASLYLGYMQFHKFISDEYVFKKDMSTMFTFAGLVSRLSKHPNVFTDLKISALLKAQEKVLNGVRNALEMAPSRKIPLRYVQDIIVTLESNGAFDGSGLTSDTLRQMAPQLFGRWLTLGECGTDCDLLYLNIQSVDVLKNFLTEWQERQFWINDNGANLNQSRISFVSSKYKERGRRSLVISNFLEVLSKVGHVHWEDYVVIGERNINYKDLVIFNSIYTLAHLFVRPFNNNGSKSSLVDYYLNAQQAQDFYQWLRPLALDLKLGDPRSRTSGKLALTEINLFGSHAKDHEKLDFAEAVEYFEIAISTGLKSENIMENHFIECREATLPLDVFDFQRFNAECAREKFAKQHVEVMLSSLPKLVKYLDSHPTADRALYLNYLEKAGRQGLIVDEPFETDAYRMMGSISQYAESLFLRFDRDQNDVLTTEEITLGLKHIIPNIRETIKSSLTKETAKTLYTYFPDFEQNLIIYIFRQKQIPAILFAETNKELTTQALVFKGIIAWQGSDLKRLQVSREDVLLVISALSSFNRSNRLKTLNALFFDQELVFEKGLKNLLPENAERKMILGELSRLVQCSEFVESDLQDWIVNNQGKYWDEVLVTRLESSKWNIFGWKPAEKDIVVQDLTSEALQNGIGQNWQKKVTQKFIELLFQDQKIGPKCTLPFLEEVHRFNPEQGVAN